MEDKKKNGKFEYEKPGLVDMMRTGARGQADCNPFGSSAIGYCYDGMAAGGDCVTGPDVTFG